MDSPNVLVVDDDEGIRLFHEELFQQQKFRVYTAVDGEDALKQLDSIPLPSLIITDLQMYPLNGRDFIKALRANPILKDIPVLVVTGEPGEIEMDSDIITLRKPVSRNHILWAASMLIQTRMTRTKI